MKKSEKTILKIIEKTKELFNEKGYSAVSMKDICEKCEMSRGGLYRYFSSPKEIFLAMMDRSLKDSQTLVNKLIHDKIAPHKIFLGYLKQEKEKIFSPDRGIYFAMHEFAFVDPGEQFYFKMRLAKSIGILGKILEYGQQEGEFKEFDVEVTVTHILYFVDNLKTSSTVFDPSEEVIDKQFDLIKDMVIRREKL